MNKPVQVHPIAKMGNEPKVRVQIPMVMRVRFQLGGGLFLAVVAPAVVRYQGYFGFVSVDNAIQTMVGAMLAIIVGYFVVRRLSSFPGDMSRSHTLFVYSVTFGITMSIFFLTRLDYSRFLFLASYLICLFWFGVVQYTVLRTVKIKLAIIPGGNAAELLKINKASWTVLESIQMYDPKYGAIVADLRGDLSPEWERFIAERTLHGISVFHSKQVQEMLTGKVDIEHLSENNFGSLLPEMDYLRFRQVIDIVATIILLPIILFVMSAVAIIILATSGGPVFFNQQRVGYRGVLFTAYKFRTMLSADEDDLHSNASNNAQNLRDSAMTVKNDKRVTPFGAFLRKYRIDELPQVFNILKGEMGWIGPRPEALALSHWYQEELPFYSYRHVIRPGITGWAQVNQGHVTHAEQVLEKLHYDFFYIKNLSGWLDFLIVLKTVKVVLFGIGAK